MMKVDNVRRGKKWMDGWMDGRNEAGCQINTQIHNLHPEKEAFY